MFFGQCLKVNDGPSVIGRRLGSRAETGGWWVGRWNSATKKYGFTQGKHGDTERIRICRIWYVYIYILYMNIYIIYIYIMYTCCRSIHRKTPKRCNNMTLSQCNSSLFGWDVTFLSFLGCYLCIRIYIYMEYNGNMICFICFCLWTNDVGVMKINLSISQLRCWAIQILLDWSIPSGHLT
jgi:uncharacterized membrane protein